MEENNLFKNESGWSILLITIAMALLVILGRSGDI